MGRDEKHDAVIAEHDTTGVRDSFTQNSRVYLIAIVAYCGIILFGYDTGVGGSIVSLPSMMKAFGYYDKSAQAKADIESWIVSSLMLGAFVGALGNAATINILGRKKGLFLAVAVFCLGAILQFVKIDSLSMLIAGRVIAGVGIGSMSATCPLYVSELAEKSVRGRITGLFQILVVIGVALSYWLGYGMNKHHPNSVLQWRFALAFQLVPAGIMAVLLPFVRESPRWQVSKGRTEEALNNLAWLRKRSPTDPKVVAEFAEIEAAHREEMDARSSFGLKDALAKGNRQRFFIAFMLFFCQQWSGQNSINYYAPTIFSSIGLRGTNTSLLASGVYGAVKIVATTIFVLFGLEKAGRRKSLLFGGFGMSLFLWIVGAIFITHIPDKNATSPSGASIGMAVMIYMFVIPYCFSWAPIPWVYCSEMSSMGMRHYIISVAAASQWIFNFTLSKITPTLVLRLPNGRLFFLFAAFNLFNVGFAWFIPETCGRTLEEMDVVFGSVSAEQRARDVEAARAGVLGGHHDAASEDSSSINKGTTQQIDRV